MPGETCSELRQTVEFAKEIDADYTVFSIATPFPGSELAKTVEVLGLMKKVSFRAQFPRNDVFFETEHLKAIDVLRVRWIDWADINFSSPEKVKRIQEIFGTSEAGVQQMARSAIQKWSARFPCRISKAGII